MLRALEDMTGDDRVRFCTACSKNAYDLSSLDDQALAQLIVQTEGRLCGRLRKRRDGRVLNGDCPKR